MESTEGMTWMSNLSSLNQGLEREFESTLTEEIIPGILHNFANPLNGIMGRSKLLQRKLEISKEGDSVPDFNDMYNKVIRDVDLISRDTDRLSVLLQNVAEKLNVVNNKLCVHGINLSEILAIEMSFFDFHLDFKHNVKKTLDLSPDIPEVNGVPADFSLSLWALIRCAMLRMKNCDLRELVVATENLGDCVLIKIANTGTYISQDEWVNIVGFLENKNPNISESELDSMLLSSILLLTKYHAQFQLDNVNGMSCLKIRIPVK
jgi:nitrogen-specific signal transduction histidine kinase